MSNTYLEVTSQPEALSIEPGGSGTITYVVTNRTGQDDHVRVKRQDSTVGSPLALELQGEEQQRVSSGGTATFSLKVTSSRLASPANCEVTLAFIAALMSETAFSAPVTRVSILASKPVGNPGGDDKKRKKTWWIVLGATALLLIAGIAIGAGRVSSSCEADTQRSCGKDGRLGNCGAGVQQCGADGQWGTCSISPKTEDACAPDDDANCNGTPDEAIGRQRSCAEDGWQGACAAGIETCEKPGQWSQCSISLAECGAPPKREPLYLSDLDAVALANIHGDLQRDRVYWQADVWIAGQQFKRGLGMHAPATGTGYAEFIVPSGYHRFVAKIGLARQDGNAACSERGDAAFEVFVDGVSRMSRRTKKSGELEEVLVDQLGSGSRLRLAVDNANGTHECDHAFWADARLED